MPSAVSICNEALAEIAADAIASMDEASVSARECNRVFDNVVADLLERSNWGFLVRRTTASPITNVRPGEWNYAYSKPSDAAKVLRVLPPDETSYPEWGTYSTPIWDAYGPIPFIEVGGTVFANVETAVVEYALSTVEISAFPPLFRRAVAMELASRVAMPVKKDRAIKGDMIQQAEIAFGRAVAEDRNRYPHRQQEYVSAAEMARAGYDC